MVGLLPRRDWNATRVPGGLVEKVEESTTAKCARTCERDIRTGAVEE
jgi:hypothetical protein